MRSKKLVSFVSTSLLALSLLGCGSSNSTTISTDGSTSMEKVIGILGEQFEIDHSDFRVTYNPTGSTSGIQAVIDQRCEIGLSSRALKDEEMSEHPELSAEVVALDGIAIIVNPNNPIEDISLDELKDIYTGKTLNWSDLGGSDGEIVLIGREAGSGTRDGFESVTHTKDSCTYRQELTSTGDVIATCSSNEHAIGYASLAGIKDSVKILKVDGVLPSVETIQDGSYSVQRPFNMIVNKKTELSEGAKEFYHFAMSPDASWLIEKAGAIPTH